MSTNKTQHYQLHSWAAEDKFLRGEMNENFTAIDTAIKQAVTAAAQAVQGEASARASAVATLNTAIGKKAEVVTGVYTGDGAATRNISLGFAPKAVFVIPADGAICSTYSYYGGLAVTGNPVVAKSTTMLTLTATGFQVNHTVVSHTNYNSNYTCNSNGKVYHYLAVR